MDVLLGTVFSTTIALVKGEALEFFVKIFSGKATTTGPGRPEIAVNQALAIISGILSTSLISTVHFATSLNALS